MTLALYGKTKRRQSGLMLAALMAILFAALGGVAVISSAFAHHLEPDIKPPTCQDQSWRINVNTGQWSEFREAVLTNTTGSVAMVRTPFVSNSFNTSILSVSGTGAVHLAGDVTQYLGAFSSPVQIDAIDSSTTSLHASSGTFAGYLSNDVILVGTEMMKVTGIPDSTHLTVTRGFGTAASAHVAGSVSRWVRGGVDLLGNPHTITWNLNFDPATDCGGFITISEGSCTVGAAPAWTFHLLAPNDAQAGQTLTLMYHYNGEAVDAHTLTQVENGSNPTKADWLVSIPFSGHATITLDHATATGGLTWNGVQGVTNAVASSTACASTTGTVVVKKITSGSASNDTDKFGVLVKLGSTTVQTILTTDAPGLSESTPKIYSSQTAGSYTVEENNNNGYTLLGYSAGVNTNGVYTCPNSPVASTTGSASQSLAANGTIVFCIFNQKDAVVVVAPPTVEKAQDSPAIDGGRAHWTIKITNTQANNAVQNGFVVTDSGATLDSVSTAGACGALGASPFTCNVAANSVLTLHVSKPLSAATNANDTCAPGTIDNTATAALASGTPVTVKSTNTSITVPATASLACPPSRRRTATTIISTRSPSTTPGPLRLSVWSIRSTRTAPPRRSPPAE